MLLQFTWAPRFRVVLDSTWSSLIAMASSSVEKYILSFNRVRVFARLYSQEACFVLFSMFPVGVVSRSVYVTLSIFGHVFAWCRFIPSAFLLCPFPLTLLLSVIVLTLFFFVSSQLPAYFTKSLRENLEHVSFASNPCRLRFFSQVMH